MPVHDQLQLVSLISFRNKTVLTINYLFYIGYAHRRIVWKYISPLHLLNKNENIINAGYWLCENRTEKLIPIENNQSVLIAKISSRKTQKNGQSAKISCHTVASRASSCFLEEKGMSYLNQVKPLNFELLFQQLLDETEIDKMNEAKGLRGYHPTCLILHII